MSGILVNKNFGNVLVFQWTKVWKSPGSEEKKLKCPGTSVTSFGYAHNVCITGEPPPSTTWILGEWTNTYLSNNAHKTHGNKRVLTSTTNFIIKAHTQYVRMHMLATTNRIPTFCSQPLSLVDRSPWSDVHTAPLTLMSPLGLPCPDREPAYVHTYIHTYVHMYVCRKATATVSETHQQDSGLWRLSTLRHPHLITYVTLSPSPACSCRI